MGNAWSALGVRSVEVPIVQRLFVASFMIGLALVTFFSGANARFLDVVGADALPWVYLVNAPLVVAAGLAYAAWSRRTATTTVLTGSIWLLAATVAALWLWNLMSDGPAAPFALAVWFRFLFIFGFLGLWEVASAVFDVRQAKRLFPAVALGAMVAFMVGGAAVTVLAGLIGTDHLIAVSALCFVLYALAFARTLEGADFDEADAAEPATPRQIVSDRFSRNLALMRSITILLVFVTEFIFYGQVEANVSDDEATARFLGLFLAGGTLAMVIVTATIAGWYIARFGVGVGLATMPAGLLLAALGLGAWGLFVGVDTVFFVMAVATNVINMVLANAIETPVGAVLYQPMPADKRMPVRVAVDGWLGSVALLVVGLLLLAFDALDVTGPMPFVWLLAIIGASGVALARTLHRDYNDALDQATTVAFRETGTTLLADLDEGGLAGRAVGDDPTAAFALASLALELDDRRFDPVTPALLDHDDDEVALVAIAAFSNTETPGRPERLRELAIDTRWSTARRAAALAALRRVDPVAALAAANAVPLGGDPGEIAARSSPLDVQAAAARLDHDPGDPLAASVTALATAHDAASNQFAARVLAAASATQPLGGDTPEVLCVLLDRAGESAASTQETAIDATHGRVDEAVAARLVAIGRSQSRRRPTVRALASGGETSIEAIEDAALELDERYLVDLIDGVYATSTRRPPLLHRFVAPDASSRVRRAGFDALRQADVDPPATINRMVRDDVEWATRLAAVAAHATDAAEPLIALALRDEFDAARSAIWSALRTRSDADRLDELENVTETGTADDRANAIEALDSLLDRATRSTVLPVLEPLDLADAADTIGTVAAVPPDERTLIGLCAQPRLAASTRRLLDHHLAVTKDIDMADTLERVLALKRVDIFANLSYELLVELASATTERRAASGDTIIRRGDVGDELFALLEGEVAVGAGAITLRAGTVFGELALLAPGPRSADVIAADDVTMAVLSRDVLLTLAERHPVVMAEIARVLATRLQAVSDDESS